jgi:hypothetical protein
MCGKVCLKEKEAKAFCLVCREARTYYYCKPCRAWHTTTTSRGGITQIRIPTSPFT